MPAPAKNQNAAKPEEARASSFLYIRATPSDKSAWVRAAQQRGQKLSEWATDRLNRAARAN
jgi:predicted HicB family RNase H-like nuclease